MKNYIRFILKGFLPGFLLVMLLGASHSSAAVLNLTFADGNGSTSVDQYTGIAGSGWKGGWTTATGSGVTSSVNTVTNATPIYTGGDNYLKASYTVSGVGATGTTQWERVTRQIDSTGISLASPIVYSFTIRPDAGIGGSSQYITIFSSPGATNGTGNNDTWDITSDGAGWSIGSTGSSYAMGKLGSNNMSGVSYQFTIFSDPTTKTFNVSVLNLATSQSGYSGTLNYRAGAGASENTYLNFVSTSGSTVADTTVGFSIDNLSVVPEPTSTALLAAGCVMLVVLGKSRRARVSGLY